MARRDLYMTLDGDISLEPVSYYNFENEVHEKPRKVQETTDNESMMQTVRVRLMSSDPDVPDVKYKDFCANLEDLIGMPNTIETAELGVDMITRSLTFDNLVAKSNLYVRPTPVSNTEMVFYVLIKDEKDVIAFEVLLNLEDGVRIGRVGYDSVS